MTDFNSPAATLVFSVISTPPYRAPPPPPPDTDMPSLRHSYTVTVPEEPAAFPLEKPDVRRKSPSLSRSKLVSTFMGLIINQAKVSAPGCSPLWTRHPLHTLWHVSRDLQTYILDLFEVCTVFYQNHILYTPFVGGVGVSGRACRLFRCSYCSQTQHNFNNYCGYIHFRNGEGGNFSSIVFLMWFTWMFFTSDVFLFIYLFILIKVWVHGSFFFLQEDRSDRRCECADSAVFSTQIAQWNESHPVGEQIYIMALHASSKNHQRIDTMKYRRSLKGHH